MALILKFYNYSAKHRQFEIGWVTLALSVWLPCRHRFPMHSFHPAPIFLPIFPARCIIFPPPLFSVAQRIEWFISLGPSMFLSLTAQTFCKTLLLKHEQRTLVIMAKINDTFATIYLSSPKVIDIINQCKDQRQIFGKPGYHLNWVYAPHMQQRFEVQEISKVMDRHRKNQHRSN